MITELIAREEIAAARELIKPAQRVVILTHMSPDGDAMGSSLGMQFFMQLLGKTSAHVIVPNEFPAFLAWLPNADKILNYDKQAAEADALIEQADLIVGTDFNELKRIGKVGEKMAASAAKKLLIDHHLNPDRSIADVIISYPQTASSCELVFRLICRTGHFQDINLPLATCIYTGMMTDTGNFSFNSNQVETYNIVAELVRIGVDKDAVYRHVFTNYSADRMRLMGYCLYKKMKIYPEYHTALITLAGKELYQFNFQAGDAEGLVNLPLQIENVYFSVLMREDKDKIKISLRSQGDFPANKVARELFNGGGHLNASGGESYLTLQQTVAKFEAALPSYF